MIIKPIKRERKPTLITNTDTAPLIYSTRFNNYLNNLLSICKIDNNDVDIVRLLRNLVRKQCVISYVDITDKEDTVTLIPSSKIYKVYKKELGITEITKNEFNKYVTAEEDMCDIQDFVKGYIGVWNTNRVEIKIGKLIKKLNDKLTDKQIENFVNKYKALYRSSKNPILDLVSGEEISYWYNHDNYSLTPEDKTKPGVGTLGKSCMRYGSNFFDLYSKNPEVCQLLVLQSTDKKLIGRALVWTLDDGRIYMDRIYTHFDSDVYIFRKYAQDSGWLTHFEYSNGFKKIEHHNIKLKNINFDKYPFLDSFPFLNTIDGTISSTYTRALRDKIKWLKATDGGTGVLR